MKRPIESDYTSHVAYTRALEAYCDSLAQDEPWTPDDMAYRPGGSAQPAQEPFGYFKAEPFGWTDCAETDEGALALYQAPPKRPWVGLTDEEIFEIHKYVDSMQYLTFGKIIEAKLKEKNT